MNFITRAQELKKKAAELSQAVHAFPGKAAQIREAVTMTAGELKQLRTDVQTSLHSLRAESEDRLLVAMREINNHTEVFEAAGYDLSEIDLDFAVTQRLSVRLEKFEEVSESALRPLASRQSSETIRSILNGIIKAEQTAANVELTHLCYTGLTIHIGPIPMIRMHWSDPAEAEQAQDSPSFPPAQAITQHPIPSPTGPPVPPAPSKSMFDLRPLPSNAMSPEPIKVISGNLAASPAPPATASGPATAWSADALARFKTMPGRSKY